MTDDFANQAVSYLCGDLDRGDRAKFEELLERDPGAAAGLKACADAMARYALAEAGELPFDPRERAEIAARIIEASGAGRRGSRSRLAWLWPIAAAVLLALNLWQWAIRPAPPRQPQAAASANIPGQSLANAGESPAAAAGWAKPAAPVPHPRETNTEVAKAMARLAALRQEYSRLQISKNDLNAEYAKILQQLAAQEIMAQGTSRVVAIELVDSTSYANGGRPGLFDLSSAQLTKPGVVAAGPAINANNGNPANPGPAGNVSLQSAAGSPGTSVAPAPIVPSAPPSEVAGNPENTAGVTATSGASLASVTGQSPVIVPPDNGATGTSAATSTAPSGGDSPASPAPAPSSTPTEPPASSPAGASAPAAQTPYAVSLFDETQEQGYMDLYDLPQVGADQTLQLWVLPAGSDSFQNVGPVPAEYYGGSGSIYYKLPEGTATPAQIMVTVEPKSSTLGAPTGTVVLRGP